MTDKLISDLTAIPDGPKRADIVEVERVVTGEEASGKATIGSLFRGRTGTDSEDPESIVLKSGDALVVGGVTTRGADLYLLGGIGRRVLTVYDYTSLADATVTIYENGGTLVLTEGVHWTAATDNIVTAASLAAAITDLAPSLVVTPGDGNGDVNVQPGELTRSLELSSDHEGTGISSIRGDDGRVEVSFAKIVKEITTGADPVVIGEPFADVYLVTNGNTKGIEPIWLKPIGNRLREQVGKVVTFIEVGGGTGSPTIYPMGGSGSFLAGHFGDQCGVAFTVQFSVGEAAAFEWDNSLQWSYVQSSPNSVTEYRARVPPLVSPSLPAVLVNNPSPGEPLAWSQSGFGDGSAASVPIVVFYRKRTSDFTIAAALNTITIATPRAGRVLTGASLTCEASFAGGSASAVVARLGILGELDKFVTDTDMLTPDQKTVTPYSGWYTFDGVTDLVVTLEATGDDLNNLGNGILDIRVVLFDM